MCNEKLEHKILSTHEGSFLINGVNTMRIGLDKGRREVEAMVGFSTLLEYGIVFDEDGNVVDTIY